MSNSTARVLTSVEYYLFFIRVLSQCFRSPTIRVQFKCFLLLKTIILLDLAPNSAIIIDNFFTLDFRRTNIGVLGGR